MALQLHFGTGLVWSLMSISHPHSPSVFLQSCVTHRGPSVALGGTWPLPWLHQLHSLRLTNHWINFLPASCSSLTTANNRAIMRSNKRLRWGPPYDPGLYFRIYFSYLFFYPCLGLYTIDFTSVGTETVLCKKALQSLEFKELTLYRKKYILVLVYSVQVHIFSPRSWNRWVVLSSELTELENWAHQKLFCLQGFP